MSNQIKESTRTLEIDTSEMCKQGFKMKDDSVRTYKSMRKKVGKLQHELELSSHIKPVQDMI